MSNSYRTFTTLLLMLVFLAGTALMVSCSEKRTIPKKIDKLTAEQTDLIRYYHQIKQAGQAGRIDLVLRERDSVTMDFVRRFFEMRGIPIDSNIVASWANSWPDVAGLPLIQDSINGNWRRLLFMIDGIRDKENREKILLPILMFRLENGEWKFSNTSRLSSFKYGPDAKPIALEDLTFHEMFRMPPSFPDLDSVATHPPTQPIRIPDSTKEKYESKRGGQ